MAFVSKNSACLQGMGCGASPVHNMAALAVATRKTATPRPVLQLGNYVVGDRRSNSPGVYRTRRRFRTLGDVTCSIDPTTGGRVCTNDPGTATAAPAASTPTPYWNCSGVVTPRYLPDPTSQLWQWDKTLPAMWMFAGRPDPNSVYDIYVRQDNGAYASVGPGGGFNYNTPLRPTVKAYSACPTAAAETTPAATPAATQPAVVPTFPAPLVSAAPSMSPAPSTPINWMKIALIGGGGLAGVLVLKKVLK